MHRTALHDRRYRRILAAGVGASVLVHAALFASLRFEIPGLDRDSVIVLESPEPPEVTAVEKPLELLQFAAATSDLPAPAAEAGAASLSPMGEFGGATLQVATSAAIEAAITDVAAPPAFETLAVVDPLTNAAIRPIAFDALPAAATTAPAEAEDDGIEVYVPGSVGRAKRQWARGIGEGEAGAGSGGRFGIVAVGGGHCPMPGRVPVSWGTIF